MTPKIKQRFEYRTDESNKFWEIESLNDKIDIHFGKIDTLGQKLKIEFSEEEYTKRALEKLSKGYKPTTKTINMLLDNSNPIRPYKAIHAACIGEHIPDGIASDICNYLTASIHNKMPPKKFSKIWEKILDGDDLSESLGTTYNPEGDIEFWSDSMNYPNDDVDILYEKTFNKNGDRFVWLNDNAFVSIIGLRGDAGGSAIEKCVMGKSTVVVEAGATKWPSELGVGAPISHILSLGPTGELVLRNGKIIRVK